MEEPMTQEWTMLMTIVLLASGVLSFVLQVVTYEQGDRGRKSQVGALGGLLLGSLASTQQDGDLLVAFVGFLGGGAGAALGWFVALGISYWAVVSDKGRGVLEFLNRGPSGVGDYMSAQDAERRRYAVRTWSQRYGQMVHRSREELDELDHVDDAIVESVLRLWLRALADSFNYLMIDLKEPTEDQYHLRASLIRFGDRENGVGRHWISYSGMAKPHDVERTFSTESVAAAVASERVATPKRVMNPSEERQHEGETRGEASYRAYSVARITKSLVITIDWEVNTIGNEYIDILESVVDGHLAGDIADLVQRHHSACRR
jgi:hypothetical protein